MLYKKESQRGIAVYLAVVILAVILAVVLGLSAILVNQIKIIREMGYSVAAFYAAETGVERSMKVIVADNGTPAAKGSGDCLANSDYSYCETLANNANYKVEIVCCDVGSCESSFTCPSGFVSNSTCNATKYCVRSLGEYAGIKRALEVVITPVEP